MINLALKMPDHPHLVLRTYDDAHVILHDSSGIAVLEISEARNNQSRDPTGRASMIAQFDTALASPANAHSSAAAFANTEPNDVVIDFPRPSS